MSPSESASGHWRSRYVTMVRSESTRAALETLCRHACAAGRGCGGSGARGERGTGWRGGARHLAKLRPVLLQRVLVPQLLLEQQQLLLQEHCALRLRRLLAARRRGRARRHAVLARVAAGCSGVRARASCRPPFGACSCVNTGGRAPPQVSRVLPVCAVAGCGRLRSLLRAERQLRGAMLLLAQSPPTLTAFRCREHLLLLLLLLLFVLLLVDAVATATGEHTRRPRAPLCRCLWAVSALCRTIIREQATRRAVNRAAHKPLERSLLWVCVGALVTALVLALQLVAPTAEQARCGWRRV